MPFALDLQDVQTKLFLLEQLLHGSKSYCHEFRISRQPSEPGTIRGDWIIYSGYLETQVGNYIIECAIKTRMLQDLVGRSGQADPRELDRIACDEMELGTFEDGSSLRGIRDSCNRIVHATEAKLEWLESEDEEGERFEYWSGSLLLCGSHRGNEWRLTLNVDEWCLAMRYFYIELDQNIEWMSLWGY